MPWCYIRLVGCWDYRERTYRNMTHNAATRNHLYHCVPPGRRRLLSCCLLCFGVEALVNKAPRPMSRMSRAATPSREAHMAKNLCRGMYVKKRRPAGPMVTGSDEYFDLGILQILIINESPRA